MLPLQFKDFAMPWGKFKGKLLCDIPSSYLKWLSENSKNDYIATAADQEWNFRERMNKHWEE